MVVNLERNGFERCYLWVMNGILIIKDEGRSRQEKVFESDEKAITECKKFVDRRLKIGWQLRGRTDSNIFLKGLSQFEKLAEETRKEKGFDQIQCYLSKSYPGSFLTIQKLRECINIKTFDIPTDYQDFLLTVDGFMLSQKVSKDVWGNYFSLRFISYHGQKWFQENKQKITCLHQIDQPFIVVSRLNESEPDFTGAVLLVEDNKVDKFEYGSFWGSFSSFQDYFLFEKKEANQYLFDARYWVKSKSE